MSIKIYNKDYQSTVGTESKDAWDRGGIGAFHMANEKNMELYEIQRSNNFEFVVDLTQKLNYAGLTTEMTWAPQEIIRMSVSSAFIPHFSQSAIEVKRGNSTLKYAGVPTFESGNIVLNDYIGLETKDAIMAWQNLSYNVTTEKVGLASDYKKQATLIEYTPDHQVVRQWTLYGCWVSSISESEFSSDSNDKHQITATITYDKAKLEPKD